MYAPVSPGEASWGACGSPGSSRNVLRIKDRCHLPPSAPPGGSPEASSARPVASAATPCQGVVSRAVNGRPSLSCPLSPQASSSSSLPPTLSLLPCSHEAAPPPLTWQSLAWLPRAPRRPCWVPFAGQIRGSAQCLSPVPPVIQFFFSGEVTVRVTSGFYSPALTPVLSHGCHLGQWLGDLFHLL